MALIAARPAVPVAIVARRKEGIARTREVEERVRDARRGGRGRRAPARPQREGRGREPRVAVARGSVSRPPIAATRPPDRSRKPAPRRRGGRPSGGDGGTRRRTSATATAPSGRLTRNTPSQPQASVIQAPTTGPGHGRQERGPGDGGDGAHQLGLGRVAEHQHPPDRRHQRRRGRPAGRGPRRRPERWARARRASEARVKRAIDAASTRRAPQRSPAQPAAGTSAASARR